MQFRALLLSALLFSHLHGQKAPERGVRAFYAKFEVLSLALLVCNQLITLLIPHYQGRVLDDIAPTRS